VVTVILGEEIDCDENGQLLSWFHIIYIQSEVIVIIKECVEGLVA